MYKIPIYKPDLSGNEKKYVNDCLDSTWISSKGKYVNLFEEEFSKYVGIKYATTVSNGTTALHLAMITLGIGPGDEVIVPTLTYIASVNAISYTGATPVFVDSDPIDWQMDPTDVKAKITKNTKAILAVHLYGQPCKMDELKDISQDSKIFLIEDCAEAIGSISEGQHVGTFGDIGIFSFYGNKTITTGEGGMLITNDETLFNRALHFKSQGLAAYREYWHDVVGYNFRMTNICAAIGLAQLEQVNDYLYKKKKLANLYKESLNNYPLEFQQEREGSVHSYWMCCFLVSDSKDRDPLRTLLEKAGVETRPVFYPIHTMPMYSTKFYKHSNAEDISRRGINLPSWPGLSDNDVKIICDQIKNFFDKKK